jgi:hypothetical protein
VNYPEFIVQEKNRRRRNLAKLELENATIMNTLFRICIEDKKRTKNVDAGIRRNEILNMEKICAGIRPNEIWNMKKYALEFAQMKFGVCIKYALEFAAMNHHFIR